MAPPFRAVARRLVISIGALFLGLFAAAVVMFASSIDDLVTHTSFVRRRVFASSPPPGRLAELSPGESCMLCSEIA